MRRMLVLLSVTVAVADCWIVRQVGVRRLSELPIPLPSHRR